MIQLFHAGILGGPAGVGTPLLDFLQTEAWSALWPLNESAGTTMFDVQNGRNGVYSGTFSLGQGSLAPNGEGSSVHFQYDGVMPKGMGRVTSAAAFQFTTEATIFALVNSNGSGGHNNIVTMDQCDGQHGFGFHWNANTPLGFTRDTVLGTQVLAGPDVGAGNHLTAFRWRADRSSIWVDGAEVASGGGLVSSFTTDDLTVGAGLIDGCGSLTDHRLSYVAVAGVYVPDSVLIGAWAAIQ